MRKTTTFSTGIAALLLAVLAGVGQAAEYKIDEAHQDVGFKVRHAGLSWVRGTFGTVAGTLQFDEANLDATRVEITIDAASINTGNTQRDDHLRSPDFLETEVYPTITFIGTKIENWNGSSFDLIGDLTIHGVTKQVTLKVTDLTSEVTVEEWGGVTKRSATAELKIDRRDFGLKFDATLGIGNLVAGNEVFIEIEVELDKVN